MSKTPSYYVAPLKSRAAICAWLLARANENRRPGYGLFTYDVKLRDLDTSFAHALKLGREAGHVAADASPRYLAALESRWDEVMETAFEIGTEDACRRVVEDVSNRMLWDGPAEEIADWSFDGRSGGWLVLKSFDGVDFASCIRSSCMNGRDWLTEFIPERSFAWLRDLYRFLVQCDHDFRRPESEVEYLAADYFFANRTDDIPTDSAIAEREAKRAAETAEREHWEARDTVTIGA